MDGDDLLIPKKSNHVYQVQILEDSQKLELKDHLQKEVEMDVSKKSLKKKEN